MHLSSEHVGAMPAAAEWRGLRDSMGTQDAQRWEGLAEEAEGVRRGSDNSWTSVTFL